MKNAYLSTDNTSLTQSTLHCVVEGVGIQTFSRAYGLAMQHNIIWWGNTTYRQDRKNQQWSRQTSPPGPSHTEQHPWRAIHNTGGENDYKLHTGIFKGNSSTVVEVLPGHIHNILINLAHDNVLNARMLSHLTQNTTITTSDNQNLYIMIFII